jgi:Ca2+-binding EF-hand superfamily protein
MTRRLLALAALLLAAAVAAAQEKPRPGAGAVAPTPPDADARDLLFTGESRPYLVRVHLQVDGKPLFDLLKTFHKKLFDHYDLDGDGTLSGKEAGRVVNAQVLQQTLMGQGDYFELNVQRAGLAEMDTNPKDGKVSPEELAAYLDQAGASSFQVQAGPPSDTAGRQTGILWKFVDRNGDGKLSPEEAADGLSSLRKLDAEEDEAITRDEVILSQGQQVYEYDVLLSEGRGRRAPPAAPLDLIAPGQPLKPFVAKLLTRYDKDKDQKLSLEEIGLAKEVFAKLDADRDGGLGEGELAGFFSLPSDLELMVRWTAGKPGGGLVNSAITGLTKSLNPKEVLQPFAPAGRTPALNAATVKERNQWLLTTAGSQVRMQASNAESQSGLASIKQFYGKAFKKLDANADGMLERKEVELAMSNDDYFLRGLWGLADRDGDAKLTEPELGLWLDLEALGAGAFGTVRLDDQGRGLFEQLDADGNNRLSQREFRTAWDRLKAWDRDGDGLVAKDEVPKLFSLVFTQGQLNHPYFRVSGVAMGMGGPARPTAKGPAWFRKMDRNGDGDLNMREWKGTEEEFRRYDADGDGLVSAEEAERLEKKDPETPPKP